MNLRRTGHHVERAKPAAPKPGNEQPEPLGLVFAQVATFLVCIAALAGLLGLAIIAIKFMVRQF